MRIERIRELFVRKKEWNKVGICRFINIIRKTKNKKKGQMTVQQRPFNYNGHWSAIAIKSGSFDLKEKKFTVWPDGYELANGQSIIDFLLVGLGLGRNHQLVDPVNQPVDLVPSRDQF